LILRPCFVARANCDTIFPPFFQVAQYSLSPYQVEQMKKIGNVHFLP